MSKKPKKSDDIDEADATLFREMMNDVTPLAPDNKIEPSQKPLKPFVRSNDRTEDSRASSQLFDFVQTDYADSVDPEQSLYFARPGLQHKTGKRLRRGQIPVEAHLDLHGLTIEEAARETGMFIAHAQESGFRCILIVHGKGHRSQENKPVLKSQVNHWLRQHPAVLAFSSALPGDGGVGAVYVLLRKGE